MELNYPPDAEAFRGEVRVWLEENLPTGWFEPGFHLTPEQRGDFNATWTEKLCGGGWICASWPKEYGGKGLTVMQNVVANEEFHRAGAPLRADFFGDTLVGPTILQWGTEDQKKHFLPQILKGEISWCQGFSEPDSGSDLASLKTTAVVDGDEWVINGQKVWTTRAQHADYVFLLARTDPAASQHAGISYLLVPMKQAGVEVRPIIQPDGTGEFNETWFTNARCPKANVVGGVNNGWKVAMTTLGFERGSSATTGHRRFELELDLITERAKQNGSIEDARVRQRLAKAYSKVQIMRFNGVRSLTYALHKRGDVVGLGATNKMFWSEYHREVMELAMDVWGMESQILTGGPGAPSWPGQVRHDSGADYPVSPMQSAFFFSRSETIWGGTAEVQRNLVGERVLGLPKEPKPGGTGNKV